jgi:hypothetical protein
MIPGFFLSLLSIHLVSRLKITTTEITEHPEGAL